MNKPWLRVLPAFLVAGVSVFLLVMFRLGYLMRPMPSAIEATLYAALAVIVVGFCAALICAWRAAPRWFYALALMLMLLAGIAPSIVDSIRLSTEAANESAERSAFEAKFLSELDAYKKDIAVPIAGKNPFALREAQKFLDFVQGSDLSHRGLPDHSAQAFALLKRTLDEKVLDPNTRVKGPRAVDTEEEPLFVAYYKFYLQSGATMPQKRVREREWKLFQMLIAGGANLDDPAAAVLRDEVKRETEPYGVPGWLTLK